LAIAGEQGSAKTVLSNLRALIDPSVAPVRALPRDERELFIAASNGHVLAFDNLSGLPPWLSDTLCLLTSGGAFSTRRLFTDQDEMLFAAARPVIVNGIEDIITRPDLADRAILLMLATIAERQRRLARVRARTTAYPWGAPRCRRAWVANAAAGASQSFAADGRLRTLGHSESTFRRARTFNSAYSKNRYEAIENIIDGDPRGCLRA
jgi:hypothetical protein